MMMRGRRTREEDHDGEMKIVFEGVNGFFCSYSSSLLQTNFHPVRRSFVPKKEKSIIR